MKMDGLNIIGPMSFQDYLSENHLPAINTASSISIDSYEKLNPLLKNENLMIFRLGQSDIGKGTQFVLRKVRDFSDYFILDEMFTKEHSGHEHIVNDKSILIPYRILSNLTESSYVNLAINSGLLSSALGISNISSAATSQSAFTFRLKLHSEDEKEFLHSKGQVEIDSLFIAEKNGKKYIFVLEAKSDNIHKSLAKHKLVYPVLAIAHQLPSDIEIIPVYMKVIREKNHLHFYVVECSIPDPRKKIIAINELHPVQSTYLNIEL